MIIDVPRGQTSEDWSLKLLAFLYDSYLLRRRLKVGSSNALIWSLGKFNEWLGRPATFEDLREDTLSRFIRDLEGSHKATYLKRLRADLISIWNDAADEHPDEVKPPNTKRIRAVKVPQTTPEAWPFSDVVKLLKACDSMTGVYEQSGIPRAGYWRAWVLIAWDTGIRPSDVRLVRFDQIRDASIALTQEKTGNVHWAALSQPTLDSVEAIREPKRDVILPWDHTKQTMARHFDELTKAAGLVGTPKKLRKSAASEVERQQPGAAQQFLGQRTPGLAYKNYVDPRIANPVRPRPQSLDD